MAINIKFDSAGNPEPPTIVLATRSGKKLGQLNVDPSSIELNDKFNDASEFSFTLNKYYFDEKEEIEKVTNLWDKVVNFKLVWCKEWEMWFEITVELDEETETVKTVFCKQLGQAELSQIMLYNIEINTEKDIEREDYKITILYNDEDKEASILHRLLKDKAPHYSIIHVDSTIAKLQRSFSFDGTSIYDAFMDIAEEIGCLFVFNSDENGNISRTISVFDLQQTCKNPDCKHRGEFIDICPKCGSTDIEYGYGSDTSIFVTSDELASGGIQLTTDTDSVKNCFKLEAGDDLMTATVRSCNPNGTDYMYRFSDDTKEDMSEELIKKIENYDILYKKYYNEEKYNLDEKLLNNYNSIVNNYRKYYNKTVCLNCGNDGDFEGTCPNCGSNNILIKSRIEPIDKTIIGYSNLINAYYDTIDLALYLESALMPSVEISETNAEEQAKLLTTSSLSPVAVTNIDTVSLSTADSAVLAMAKVIIKSIYKVEIENSELIKNNNDTATWKGNFTVTNYSDEEDTYTTGIISVTVNDDEEKYIKQKIDKTLNKEDTDDYSISGLFEKEYNDFCAVLKKYALNLLISFRDSGQSCLDILIEQGVGNDKTSDLYEKLYDPYYNKLKAIESEIEIRENEINIIKGVYDLDGNLIKNKKGLQNCIEELKNKTQDILNFQNYLGADLWYEFCSYRREDKYSNDNYVSDGLSNAEILKKAIEFIEVAENEIYKASEQQHSISTSLNNLLAIKKFKTLVDSFGLGNWIRVKIDEKIYKLRLIEYGISFGSFDSISVEFSDATKIKNGITDVENVLSQASSMATNYSSIQRQAEQGNKAKGTISEWITSGLNSALVQIQNNNSEEVTFDKNGLLARSYNEITDTYSPEQLKVTHNILAYTDNNWETTRLALGKHEYPTFNNGELGRKIGYGLSADFVTAGVVSGSQIIGGDVYSSNYSKSKNTGSYLNLLDGTFSFGGGALKFENGKLTISSKAADTNITEINEEWLKTTSVYAEYLKVNSAKIEGKLTADQINTSEIKVSSLINDSGYQNKSQVTTITNDTIKTTNVIAQNLRVQAANIDGTLTAKQIDTKGLIAEDISATEIKGKKISGGSIDIGNGNFSVDGSGNLIAKNADVIGKISATSGDIAKINIVRTRTPELHCYSNSLSTDTTTVDIPVLDAIAGDTEYKNKATSVQAGMKCAYASNELFFYVKAKPESTTTWGAASDETLFYVRADGMVLSRGLKVLAPNTFSTVRKDDGSIRYRDDNDYFISTNDDYMNLKHARFTSSTIPYEDSTYNMGSSSRRWKNMYSENGVSTTSDRNFKKDIKKLTDVHKQFFMKLIPVSFMFTNPNSDRNHIGFIAQDVEQAMAECGLTSLDFAGLCKDIKKDNEKDVYDKNGNPVYIYSLRYTEFIGIITQVLQDTVNRLDKIEELVKQLIKN